MPIAGKQIILTIGLLLEIISSRCQLKQKTVPFFV
jgi:hypothetical protein